MDNQNPGFCKGWPGLYFMDSIEHSRSVCIDEPSLIRQGIIAVESKCRINVKSFRPKVFIIINYKVKACVPRWHPPEPCSIKQTHSFKFLNNTSPESTPMMCKSSSMLLILMLMIFVCFVLPQFHLLPLSSF